MTNVALSGEPGPGGTCRVCGSALDGSGRCVQCGATYGEANRCPHCGSVSDVDTHGSLRQRCRVCGGPRVPLDDPNVVRSGRELPLLKKADRARLRSAAWRLVAGVVGGFGLLSAAVATLVTLVASPGLLAGLGMLAISMVPFGLSLFAFRRGSAISAEVTAALDEAWALVASDVLRQRGSELTSAELARLLRTDVGYAERLLARLGATDLVHARVTEEGDVLFASTEPPRLRVGLDDRAASEAAAEAEATAIAEAERKTRSQS